MRAGQLENRLDGMGSGPGVGKDFSIPEPSTPRAGDAHTSSSIVSRGPTPGLVGSASDPFQSESFTTGEYDEEEVLETGGQMQSDSHEMRLDSPTGPDISQSISVDLLERLLVTCLSPFTQY